MSKIGIIIKREYLRRVSKKNISADYLSDSFLYSCPGGSTHVAVKY